MAAILALHHSRVYGRSALADLYGNDPFVWTSPFLWSHCHTRGRPITFGLGRKGPTLWGKDAVFFLTLHPVSNALVCDAVFLIQAILPIAKAESLFAASHPARHYHFDQLRNPYHTRSTLTRVADPNRSFVLDPPLPIGSWIDQYVKPGKLAVKSYFRMNRRKNVRVMDRGVSTLYMRVKRWGQRPGHQLLSQLPLRTLRRAMHPTHPGNSPIRWPV